MELTQIELDYIHSFDLEPEDLSEEELAAACEEARIVAENGPVILDGILSHHIIQL